MFCTNCGKEIASDSKFCPKCGTPVDDIPVRQEGPEVKKDMDSDDIREKAEDIKKNIGQNINENLNKAKNSKIVRDARGGNKKAIGILAGGVVAVVVIILLVVTMHKPTLNLADYTEITFTGAQGYGRADVEFDSTQFVLDVLEHAKIDGKKLNLSDLQDLDYDTEEFLSELYGNSTSIYQFAACLDAIVSSGEFDTNESLSNGDKVTYSFTYDNDELKKYGIKLKGGEVTEEVSGLEEAREINPFDGVEVTFNGTSPNATAEYTRADMAEEALDSVQFTFDRTEGLKTGDTVTLTAEADNAYLAENYGVVLSETEKTYTVEGIQSYAMSADQIPADILGNMQAQAEDCISAYFASNADYISVQDTAYAGYYFLSHKDNGTAYYTATNKIYLIYSGTVKSKEEEGFAKTKVYFPVYFEDIMVNADGTGYAELGNASIQGSTDLQFGWWNHVSGFTNKAEMLNDLVTADKGDYDTGIVGEELQ